MDRHEKWVKVEPGHVIPAGQPYRVEDTSHNGDPTASEAVIRDQHGFTVPAASDWFVDSSWKPPLVLPTEWTWGVVRFIEGVGSGLLLRQWSLRVDGLFVSTTGTEIEPNHVADFIPLTDEQVARIEAAR